MQFVIYSFEIQNMVGPGEVDDELEPEIKEECNTKYGDVSKVMIYEIPKTTPEEAVPTSLPTMETKKTSSTSTPTDTSMYPDITTAFETPITSTTSTYITPSTKPPIIYTTPRHETDPPIDEKYAKCGKYQFYHVFKAQSKSD